MSDYHRLHSFISGVGGHPSPAAADISIATYRKVLSVNDTYGSKHVFVFGCVVEAAECLAWFRASCCDPSTPLTFPSRASRLAALDGRLAAWKLHVPKELRGRSHVPGAQWACEDSDGRFAPQIVLAHALYNAVIITLRQGKRPSLLVNMYFWQSQR